MTEQKWGEFDWPLVNCCYTGSVMKIYTSLVLIGKRTIQTLGREEEGGRGCPPCGTLSVTQISCVMPPLRKYIATYIYSCNTRARYQVLMRLLTLCDFAPKGLA